MKRAYDEIMDNIQINDAMRKRILQNIAETDFNSASSRKITFPYRWTALAACIALVVFMGGVALQNRTPVASTSLPGTVSQVSPIAVADTLEALEKAVDFPVEEAAGLPFMVEETAYRAISGKIAEIAYTGQGKTAVLRKSVGTEDNSGSYTEYPKTVSLTLNQLTGQLRGGDEGYSLAVWSDGSYTWSLKLSEAMDEAAWTTLISDISD